MDHFHNLGTATPSIRVLANWERNIQKDKVYSSISIFFGEQIKIVGFARSHRYYYGK